MKNGISIVMTYHNRKELLIRTLDSIKKSSFSKSKLEIIIVNDASSKDHEIDDLIYSIYNELNLKIINIKEKQKKWNNSCVPYNIGFNYIKYDKVIIQNPECYHNGDILTHVHNNLNNDNYLSYGCYSLNWENTINSNYENIKINDIKSKGAIYDGWYNHSIINPTGYHFCSSITYENLCKLNGFDERYKDGIGYDDNEFVYRIKKLGLDFKIIDTPFVFHQAHKSVFRFNSLSPQEEKDLKLKLFDKNYNLFINVTKKDVNYKITNNIFFNMENNIKEINSNHQKEKLTILIPFMNREENLKVFIPYMHNYMKNYFPEIIYEIVVVEQVNDKPFNKGILFNAGYVLTSGNTDYYALHDVDQLPLSSNYKYDEWPNHLCVNCLEQSNDGVLKNFYENTRYLQKGGSIIVTKPLYEKCNGHSNLYWGWGCIDDDFAIRLELTGHYFKRYGVFMNHNDKEKNKLGYYITLNANTQRYDDEPNYLKNTNILKNFYKNLNHYKSDGLNNLNFDLLEEVISNEYIRYKINF